MYVTTLQQLLDEKNSPVPFAPQLKRGAVIQQEQSQVVTLWTKKVFSSQKKGFQRGVRELLSRILELVKFELKDFI